jgi:2-dehydro-3-deoxygluconokinase
VGVLIVKDGERAAVSFDPDGRVEVAALPVEVAEPIGAGDAFAAGWLHAHLRGLSAAAKLRLGHLMAAGSLTSPTDHPMTPVPAAELLAMATDQATWPPPGWPGPDLDAEDA